MLWVRTQCMASNAHGSVYDASPHAAVAHTSACTTTSPLVGCTATPEMLLEPAELLLDPPSWLPHSSIHCMPCLLLSRCCWSTKPGEVLAGWHASCRLLGSALIPTHDEPAAHECHVIRQMADRVPRSTTGGGSISGLQDRVHHDAPASISNAAAVRGCIA